MRMALAVTLAILTAGCCGVTSREKAFYDGVKDYTVDSGMLSEYEKYVDADPALKPETKKIRKDTSKGLRALIDEEGKALKKGE